MTFKIFIHFTIKPWAYLVLEMLLYRADSWQRWHIRRWCCVSVYGTGTIVMTTIMKMHQVHLMIADSAPARCMPGLRPSHQSWAVSAPVL